MQMLAGVLALALSAAACGGDGEDATDLASTTTVESNPITGPPDGDQPTRGGVVSWGLEAEPDSMNSAFGQWASSGHFVASAVFDPIATIDENGEAVPYLAESLTPNDDFTEWTIALREGITFHDGTPVDADALLANLEAYRQSPITADALAPVTQLDRIDDRTVRLTADQRWATFPWIMTLQTGYVMAPAMVTDGSKSRSPIGSGPFVFKEWIDGESVTLERNPDYWRTDDQGEALPYLDGMAFAFIPDEPERLNQLTRGDLDAIIGYKADTILGLREAGDRFKVVENSAGEEDVLTLNTAFPPFDNINARLAVIHATDSAAVRDDVNKGVPGEATSPFAPGQLGYADDNGYPAYDPDLAREYLETYKQETGDDVLDFVYLNYGSTDDQAEAQLMAEQWAAVGIEATVEYLDQATLIQNIVFGDYQVADWRNWSSPDPDGDYMWWHSNSIKPARQSGGPYGVSLNVARYGDPEIDRLLDEARASEDQALRDANYQQVAQLINEGAAYIFMQRVVWVAAANPRVNGIYAGANGTVQTIGNKTWLAELWVGDVG
jgi:ABC-type transport system substrate-binding protein